MVMVMRHVAVSDISTVDVVRKWQDAGLLKQEGENKTSFEYKWKPDVKFRCHVISLHFFTLSLWLQQQIIYLGDWKTKDGENLWAKTIKNEIIQIIFKK